MLFLIKKDTGGCYVVGTEFDHFDRLFLVVLIVYKRTLPMLEKASIRNAVFDP